VAQLSHSLPARVGKDGAMTAYVILDVKIHDAEGYAAYVRRERQACAVWRQIHCARRQSRSSWGTLATKPDDRHRVRQLRSSRTLVPFSRVSGGSARPATLGELKCDYRRWAIATNAAQSRARQHMLPCSP